MRKKIIIGLCGLALSAVAAGCTDTASNTNTAVTENTNTTTTTTSTAATTDATRTAPDNSEIIVEETGGVRTETRTFKDPNSRVERVVVTNRDGRRTARVHYRDQTVKELPENDVERALDATGDALVSAGGKTVDVTKDAARTVADKTEDVGGFIGDKAEDAAGQTVKGAKAVGRGTKAVGSEVADKAEDVGGMAVSGAKTVGSKTAEGAKKTGRAIKDAVTP